VTSLWLPSLNRQPDSPSPDGSCPPWCVQPLLTELGRAGLGAEHDPDIVLRLWKKLCVNACINPTTALAGCRNGLLGESVPLRSVVRDVAGEVARVMGASGYPATREELEDFVYRVIEQTAGNESSMLRDVRCGRRTEIEFINGYIVEKARESGVSVPLNNLLYRLVQGLDEAGRADTQKGPQQQ
jgi:2-dehydropantoate 2-reductase